MVFNSVTFILFFLVVLVLHNLPLSWRFKKVNLVWASYVFYAAWNPPFVLLLMVTTVVDWFAARGMYAARTANGKHLWLLVTLGSNLGMLGLFKYGTFLLQNTTAVLGGLGIRWQAPHLGIILPIGISFYTFVTLSYTLDIYFGRIKPWDSFLDYCLLVTFFPHLVAGPILRAGDFLPQCRTERKPTPRQFSWGLALLVLGLFEKSVLADYFCAPTVETVYDSGVIPGFTDVWCGTLAFAGQIFFDFAGYSTCALGIAQCLGFWLPQNFRYPYAAIGFSDFWRRWHISLSSWLRDYLYIPLGGNRLGPFRTYVNLMVTMLLGGLWHGASWTYVVWGGLHGCFLSLERLVKARIGASHFWWGEGKRPLLALLTFFLICMTWVFFRASTLHSAFGMCLSMVGFGPLRPTPLLTHSDSARVLLLTLVFLTGHWFMRERTLESVASRVPWLARAAALAGMFVSIAITPGADRAFIYFQF